MNDLKVAPKKMQSAKAVKKEVSTSKVEKPPIKVVPKSEAVQKLIEASKPSAEDRIKSAENFSILTKKFSFLKGKTEELKKFEISSDGSKEALTLKNASGFELKVSNSILMEKVVSLLSTEFNTLLSKIEKDVQEFVI